MSFTKQELYAALQLSPKYNNEHVTLSFTADQISDSLAASLSTSYSRVVSSARTTTHAIGFALRDFADQGVAAVVADLSSPPVEPAKPAKKTKVEKVEEPAVKEEPVVNQAEEEPTLTEPTEK